MKMKKAIALFMTVSLAAGLLAGCGGSSNGGGSACGGSGKEDGKDSSGKIELEFFT